MGKLTALLRRLASLRDRNVEKGNEKEKEAVEGKERGGRWKFERPLPYAKPRMYVILVTVTSEYVVGIGYSSSL